MPLTVSEAISIFERAFRTKNPYEIERVLRENINVQIAVIDSIENAEDKLNNGDYPLTVPVPYELFKSKVKEKALDVYRLTLVSKEEKSYKLERVFSDEILPYDTYFLIKEQAGYHPKLGLTFEGEGESTGFDALRRGEKLEKITAGREQTWEEHAIGTYNRADRILTFYKPFLSDWIANTFIIQELSEEQITETLEALTLAIKLSALFHDVGKLRKEWQEAVGWKPGQAYIARTNLRHKVPFHAPYAYPFVKTILRLMFGDFRFLDAIALAAARHHSLEVTGYVESNAFQLADDNVKNFLVELLLKIDLKLPKTDIEQIIQAAIDATNKGSLIDEPPSPSDDFYFIYTITNRVVKFADWEDAGNETIELSERGGT